MGGFIGTTAGGLGSSDVLFSAVLRTRRSYSLHFLATAFLYSIILFAWALSSPSLLVLLSLHLVPMASFALTVRAWGRHKSACDAFTAHEVLGS